MPYDTDNLVGRNMKLTTDSLIAACADDAFDAGIQIRNDLQPLGGAGSPVKPAVYAGNRYQLDRRWIGDGDDRRAVDAVSIDNVPSQANRLEAALERLAPSVGLPQIDLDLSSHPHLPPHIPPRLSAYRFPHRNADAYMRDSELEGIALGKTDLGRDLFTATPWSPEPLLRSMPHALLYGFWQSHLGKNGPQTKLARSWTSEIIGYEPGSTETRRLGLKGDPMNLNADDAIRYDPNDTRAWELIEGAAKKGSKSKDSLAEVGHGQVPVSGADAPLGSVSFRSIEQIAYLSFAGLRNLGSIGSATNAPLRALVASIGILAHVGAFGRGFTLRSGADLVPEGVHWTWLGESSDETIDPPTIDQAKSLFAGCQVAAAAAGLPVGDWAGDPIVLTPNAQLLRVLAQTFPEYEL